MSQEDLLADPVADEPHRLAEGAPGDVRFQIGPEEVDEMIAVGGALRAGSEVHDQREGLSRPQSGRHSLFGG